MLPLHKVIWHEWRERVDPVREPEPCAAMEDLEQIRSYVKAYEWGGPTSALQLHHLRELSLMIRPGDTIVDLACGPGPLLLELAPLYPDCRFVGVDLSQQMLVVLREQAQARGLRNVEILYEDIRTLPGLHGRQVDMVITTSALHHLPDLDGLRATFQRIGTMLADQGGFYIFDFALLRSVQTRRLMVAEVAKLAPPITAKDYELSLRAAFPVRDVLRLASQELNRPFISRLSSFVEFFFFLQTPTRAFVPASVEKYLSTVWASLSPAMKLEYLMLRTMRRKV